MCAMLFTGQPDDEEEATTDDDATAAFCLLLPGNTLYVPFPAPLPQKVQEKGEQG